MLNAEQIEEINAWMAITCWSLWNGCACHKEKGHTGLHVCGSEDPYCGCVWTDKQAEIFNKKLKNRGI